LRKRPNQLLFGEFAWIYKFSAGLLTPTPNLVAISVTGLSRGRRRGSKARQRRATCPDSGYPAVNPIGVVRWVVVCVKSSRIDRSRWIAAKLRHDHGAARYERRRRRNAPVGNGEKVAVGPVAIPHKK
jgi:hypothetical protein